MKHTRDLSPCHTAGMLLRPALAPLLVWVFAAVTATAQGAPPGYYDSVDSSSASALRASLHQVIDDHQRFPYTSSSTDTWDILEEAQENPGIPSQIIDIYRNTSYTKQGGGNSLYNREHPWPNSYGFPDDGSDNYPFTDCHVLFLCNSSYNSARSNKPYRYCAPSCTERTTIFTNGQGGGSGVYPGNSNWTSGQFTQGAWETWIGSRGDIARAMLYLDLRYEGGTHGITGHAEPDLILVDDESLIAASNTGSNEPVAYMGILTDLLQWHLEDPVDDFERNRNEVVFSYQGNRNPFIDHPEWVDCLFNDVCGAPNSSRFCFGDGFGTPCPCSNFGGVGEGCANSTGGGVSLDAAGSSSVSADDLVLSAEGLPTGPGLYFQGNNAINQGNGNTFGDGLRCAGGQVIRLEVRFSTAGSSQTTTSIASAGGVSAGDLKRYQLWYRDPQTSPCGALFNLSNGYELTWTP